MQLIALSITALRLSTLSLLFTISGLMKRDVEVTAIKRFDYGQLLHHLSGIRYLLTEPVHHVSSTASSLCCPLSLEYS